MKKQLFTVTDLFLAFLAVLLISVSFYQTWLGLDQIFGGSSVIIALVLSLILLFLLWQIRLNRLKGNSTTGLSWIYFFFAAFCFVANFNALYTRFMRTDIYTTELRDINEKFNDLETLQLERIVRYLKAWKNYREDKNSNLKLPSGFELTILAVNNYVECDNDDKSFRETIRNINTELNKPNGFKCIRPTTPKEEDVFAEYSNSRKENFLNTLSSLLSDLDKAKNEKNFKKASEILINNQFGDRFPLGEDKNEEDKSKALGAAIGSSVVQPKPYGY